MREGGNFGGGRGSCQWGETVPSGGLTLVGVPSVFIGGARLMLLSGDELAACLLLSVVVHMYCRPGPVVHTYYFAPGA